MNMGKKTVLAVVVVGVVVVALAIAAFGWRRYVSNRPPAPSAYSVQLASKMTEASFQLAGTSFSLPYRLHVPPTLEPGRKYPLVVYLHGAGDNGSDNVRQLGSMVDFIGLCADNLANSDILKVGRAGCERCTAGSVPVHPLTTASFICGAAAGLIHALGPLPGPAGGRQGASSRGLQP